jgi:prepilin-type N-terminal cleavage/methylation domain-containing protein
MSMFLPSSFHSPAERLRASGARFAADPSVGVLSARRGFTLIELMVTVSIMVLILGTVLFKYTTFDSAILLKTLSYDIALSVRTAQSYSTSVFGSGGQFRYPYGLSFTPGATEYYFFGFLDTNPDTRPYFDVGGGKAFLVDTYMLGRSFTISDVCVVDSEGEDCDIDRLDVSFRRPEYAALFYADGYDSDQGDIQSAIIRVQSRDSLLTGEVDIGYTGHVTVTLDSNR